jgi:hypothetical protein
MPGTNGRLTPELETRIALSVASGLPIPIAAQAHGVPKSTWAEWLAKGRAGKQPYARFLDAMNEAKAAWAEATTRNITTASALDWKAGAWLLERRMPQHYSAKAKLEHSGKVDVAHVIPPQDETTRMLLADPKKAKALRALIDSDKDTPAE